MYAHLMDKALDKDYRERLLSDHLAISRAERPDEWEMDEYIKKALNLENQLKITTIALEKISTAGAYNGESMKLYAIDALKDSQL